MWHASIAALDMVRRRTLVVGEVPESGRRVMVKAAKALLSGVGRSPWSVEQFHFAIHHRKALTEEEYRLLSPSWCSIPAVHEAGRGEILEMSG